MIARTCRICICFACLSILFLNSPKCINATDGTPNDWQVRGALAAFQDSSDLVKALALERLRELRWVKVPRSDVERLLDSNAKDARVEQEAILALGVMGASDLKPKFVEYARDARDEFRRCAAIEALGSLGASEMADSVVDLALDPENDTPRCVARAARAFLAELKPASAIPKLIAALNGRGSQQAMLILGEIGAREAAPDLVKHFRDETRYTISPAATALGNLKAKDQLPSVLLFLKDKNERIRSGAIEAVGEIGDQAQIPNVAAYLSDPSESVRGSACLALGRLQATNYAQKIMEIAAGPPNTIGDSSADAIRALGLMHAQQYAGRILSLMDDDQRWFGFQNPAAFGEVAIALKMDNAVPLEVTHLKTNRFEIEPSIVSLRPLSEREILQLLSYIYDDTSRSAELRALAYFGAGGDAQKNDLISWLGYPEHLPESLTHEDGIRLLEAFATAWGPSDGLPRLQNDLQEQTAIVIKSIGLGWSEADIALLQEQENDLRKVGGPVSTRADAVAAVIASIRTKHWSIRAGEILLIHSLFWTVFIFLYPKSAKIQAIFFWNKWVRKIAGFFYVEQLLLWTPFLRARLFLPFRDALVEDAGVNENFDELYFAGSDVRKPSGEIGPLTDAVPALRGRIVIEGESGLGKTMFLRYVIANSKRVVVFLPANKCGNGVVEGIREKLAGPASDLVFLRSLIYSGAMDICIDGLNEVSPTTVANIQSFFSTNSSANIILATQPFDWTPPSGIERLTLLPLKTERIEEFLASREPTLDRSGPVRGDAYKAACATFLATAFNAQKPGEDLQWTKRVLSNPMDLSVVVQMVANGKVPNLFSLQEQQYELAAEEYRRTHGGQEFPLKRFSESVFQMRLDDQRELPPDKSIAEQPALKKYRLIVPRVFSDDKGAMVTRWYFRHDKVVDFFLVQVFVGDIERQKKYIDDPRFRGVYFLLAICLPLPEANNLREELIQRSVDSKDHTVSDGFIKILRTRTVVTEVATA